MHATLLLLCAGDLLAAPLYLLLTAAVLVSFISPLLRDLSAHGKVRSTAPAAAAPSLTTKRRDGLIRDRAESTAISKVCHFITTNDAFLVNKRLFLHFYITGLLSSTALCMATYGREYPSVDNLLHNIPTYLLLMHLSRRLYECLYVHNFGCGKMHIGGYLLGIIHYIFIPFVFIQEDWCCEAIDDGKDNVFTQSASMAKIIFGTGLCCFGQVEQYLHHEILAELRGAKGGKSPSAAAKSSQYQLPAGRWFRYVSCPHYLAEILVYISFAILLHPLKGVSCDSVLAHWEHDGVHAAVEYASILRKHNHLILLAWVATNLAVSANSSHTWYLQHFGTKYPRNRKALIPLLF
mmetsp:Transcript_22081/g.48108  ORF Transcript_22081/g.48108 Transcript_22081/m.48108 type:complete len:350 (-) Transcript_22081:30-1079(-)